MHNDELPPSLRIQISSLVCLRNSTGYFGVYWDSVRRRYSSRIGRGKTGGRLGYFQSAASAAKAYDAAARLRYGQDAKLNFPRPGEQGIEPPAFPLDEFCPAGHPRLGNSYFTSKGRSNCRMCNAAAAARYKQRRMIAETPEEKGRST